MSLVVVDTNIVSYLYKQDTRGALYAPHLLGNETAISMITVAELLQWAALRNWGLGRVQHLEATVTSKYKSYLLISIPAAGGQAFAHNVQQKVCQFHPRMRG